MLASDLAHLARDAKMVVDAGADYLHLDVPSNVLVNTGRMHVVK